MKTIFILFILLHTLYAKEIRIAVAANVSYAIEPLIKAFNSEYTDIDVQVVLGSSGKLTAQLKHGAPYGLFLSANMKYPEYLYTQGITKNKPVVYAQGALALLTTKKYDLSKGLTILTDENISKIAIANPKTAPYGIATIEALKKYTLYKILKPKFVYGESISQTVTYATRAADIGIVAKSSLYSPKMAMYKKERDWVDIPTSQYTPIAQGMVILKDTQDVKAFYDFMLGVKAKEILKSFGYSLP